MNEPSNRAGLYALGGVLLFCLFVAFGWFALHQEQLAFDRQPAKGEAAKPVAHAFEPARDSTKQETAGQTDDSASTNAAVIYRQAFDLFNALSKDQKDILRDWQTNVDASVEAELCGKIHPICDLMHQASAVTNCDWGIDPITFDTKVLPHLTASRNIARAAIWSAAHCRSNDVTSATDDTLSVLRLGHNISRSAMIGCLVEMALQGIASSYVSQNIALFRGVNGQRLEAAFDDSAYEDEPGRAMEQEADMVERFATKLSSLPADEAEKEISDWASMMSEVPSNLDQTTTAVELKQVVDSRRELASALASSSEGEYEAWLRDSTELQASNPWAKAFLGSDYLFVDKVRRYEVDRVIVVAGLAVAEFGPEALAAHPDPASGKAFVYTVTNKGFELQSAYEVNGSPYKMQFK